PAGFELEQLDLLLSLARAEDETQGGLLPLTTLVLVEPAQVQLDLALVGSLEVFQLELDDDQPSQTPVIEEEADVEVLAIDDESLLAGAEREVRARLEDEGLQLSEDGFFEVALAVGVAEAKEVQQVRVPKHEVRGEPVGGLERIELLPDQLVGLLRQRCALVEHAADLRA